MLFVREFEEAHIQRAGVVHVVITIITVPDGSAPLATFLPAVQHQ